MYVIRIWEGLGNQLFQYAFAKSLEMKTGKKVYLETQKRFNDYLPKANTSKVRREYRLDAYNITLEQVDPEIISRWSYLEKKTAIDRIKCVLNTVGLWPDRFRFFVKPHHFYRRFRMLRDNTFIMGWFQHPQYFDDIRKVLLKEFTPKKKIALPVELRNIIEREETISIHVRRGDYTRLRLSLKDQYYYNAFAYMQRKTDHPKVIVFSDDVEWVRDHLKIPFDTYYLADYGRFEDYEELLIMSRCTHNIIANSSFSWWGAWLNRNPHKIVIAPKFWFNGCTEEMEKIPKSWIEL